MRRAQAKQKLANEEEAKRLLAELDGNGNVDGRAAAEEAQQGRRNFGLQGGLQVNPPEHTSLPPARPGPAKLARKGSDKGMAVVHLG